MLFYGAFLAEKKRALKGHCWIQVWALNGGKVTRQRGQIPILLYALCGVCALSVCAVCVSVCV